MTTFSKGAWYVSPSGRLMQFEGKKPPDGLSFHYIHPDGRGIFGRIDGNREALVIRDPIAIAQIKPATVGESA